MKDSDINWNYEIPQRFYEQIEPYIIGKDHPTIEDRDRLVKIWRDAVRYRNEYPELQETIAEWSFSATAGSSLVENDPLLDAIRGSFGELEIQAYGQTSEDMDRGWKRLEGLISELRKT